jgi:hypothetical protein
MSIGNSNVAVADLDDIYSAMIRMNTKGNIGGEVGDEVAWREMNSAPNKSGKGMAAGKQAEAGTVPLKKE